VLAITGRVPKYGRWYNQAQPSSHLSRGFAVGTSYQFLGVAHVPGRAAICHGAVSWSGSDRNEAHERVASDVALANPPCRTSHFPDGEVDRTTAWSARAIWSALHRPTLLAAVLFRREQRLFRLLGKRISRPAAPMANVPDAALRFLRKRRMHTCSACDPVSGSVQSRVAASVLERRR